MLLKLVYKIKDKETVPNSFYDANVTLKLKSENDTMENNSIDQFP
jgi:hypothetical protein